MKKLKFSPTLIVIFVVVITLLTLSISYAKYVTNRKTSGVIKPKDFIFSTNYTDKQTYNIYETSFTFNVTNQDGLGKKNSTDIEYTVIVNNITTSIKKEEVNYTIKTTDDVKEHTISGLEVDKQYEIIIKSTNPISKTITHYVNVLETELESYYTVTDNSSYIVVDIYIGNTVTGEVTINYNNSKLLADNLNVLMADWFTNTGEIAVTNNTHYELIFFKTDDTVYDSVNTKINGNNVVINLN